MKANFRHEVSCKVGNYTHLLPIFSHVTDMPRRINEYDSSFFVVFNSRNGKYEVHSLEYPEGNTISLTVPHEELDQRTLDHIWTNDIRVHGKEIFRRLEISEERKRIREERQRRNFNRDFAIEHRSAFAKDAWNL